MLARLQQNCFFAGDLKNCGSFSGMVTLFRKSIERGCPPAWLGLCNLLFYGEGQDFKPNPADYVEILACMKEQAATLKTAEAHHQYSQSLLKCCTDEDFPAALELSLAAITTAIKTGPATFQYFTDLCNVLHMSRRLPEAIAAGKKALELRPNYSYVKQLLARIQWEQVITSV